MDLWRKSLPEPAPIRAIRRPGGLPWLPWNWIRKRFSPGAWEDLAALFEAYHCLASVLDIDRVRSSLPGRKAGDRCHRCGECCAQLVPEPVPARLVRHWVETGNPVHLFHSPITEGPRAGRFYTGWYYRGARLRMCPLLLRDPVSGDRFCAVYHLGPGQRPPGCEGFRPNWPHCEVSQRPLVP